MRGSAWLVVSLFVSSALAQAPAARTLTLEERIAAQEAIERVYYGHQVGASRPFEVAVPRSLIEARVHRALEQSSALERFWHTPVTAEMLDRELERMAHGSRMPERLVELFAALGNDPFLVKECLARATLVERLTRDFYRPEEEATRVSFDHWWADARRSVREETVVPVATSAMLPAPASSLTCADDDTWQNASFENTLDPRAGHTSVWTGSVMIVWGGWTDNNGCGYGVDRGGRYDPATDTWVATTRINAPTARSYHTAVWTGTRMIVWGGCGAGSSGNTNTGGLYDPISDTWTAMTSVNAPSGRSLHTAVWTGSEMIVWGGEGSSGYQVSGGRYDPATDHWTQTSLVNAPSGRDFHTAVWTGSKMVVWGGSYFDQQLQAWVSLNTGSRYDPMLDTWAATSTINAPSARDQHTAVWTGSSMLVWGGWNHTTAVNTGARYDPAADQWTSMPVPSIAARLLPTSVWTGSVMIVWGGRTTSGAPWNDGARYDPATNTWAAVTTIGAPSPRDRTSAVWTGSLMLIWGGSGNAYVSLDTGGRYDPVSNSWTPITMPPPVSARYGHSAVWTGSLMLVWGGQEASGFPLGSGARYDPATDAWSAISQIGAPEQRYDHATVWTGHLMLVWGGFDSSLLNSGGRYDPVSDTWTAISTTNAPAARRTVDGVWTGSVMIVWGGSIAGVYSNTGGRYDPATDTWLATSTTGAPAARAGYTAVWSGTRMIVWGGLGSAGCLSTGGRYDPTTDTWAPTSTVNAPAGRNQHTAVWTGSAMIVWGGVCPGGSTYSSGARYDPGTDVWTPTSTAAAPAARYAHTAVWTGHVMIAWGGATTNSTTVGGRYDPAFDRWASVSTLQAPLWRSHHSAVWTGDAMIVWGGFVSTAVTTVLKSGGRYVLVPPVDNDADGYTVCGGDCDDANPAVHPGATEVCNGIDDDCNQLVDDGIPVPYRVALLLESKSGTTVQLSWSTDPSAMAYEVVTGDLATLRSTGGDYGAGTTACLADSVTATTTSDPSIPPSDGGFWYLVRGENACSGPGSYDESWAGPRDAEIAASGVACP